MINHEGDTDGDGDIDVITTYGGRGISIFKQNDDGSIEKVRETGGEFERILSQQPNAAFFFNSENTFGSFDTRSDNKGPEPEGVDVGVIDGRTYVFVTLERAGGVMIYDVTDPANASFVGYKPPLPPTARLRRIMRRKRSSSSARRTARPAPRWSSPPTKSGTQRRSTRS